MKSSDQQLHLVFGGRLESVAGTKFVPPFDQLDLVGVFGDYSSAEKKWREKAHATVDDAHMRYFIVPLHELLQPSE